MIAPRMGAAQSSARLSSMQTPRLVFGLILSFTAGGCAASTASTEKAKDTDVLLMDIVIQKCKVPALEAYFPFASAELAGPHDNLDRLAECLTTGPLAGERLRLVGHTDPTGNETFNQRLGLWRARRVGEYLSKKGVHADRIQYESRGPKETSGDPGRFATERRVDIQILLGAGP